MNLYDLIIMLLILALAFAFWRFRAMAEAAQEQLNQYCETHDLQLLSVARAKTRVASYRGKLDLHSEFIFEFSGNGTDSYTGTLTMVGLKVRDIHTPAYRVH